MAWYDRDYSRSDWDDNRYQPQMRVRFGPVMPPAVKILIIANIVMFISGLFLKHHINFLAYQPYYAIMRFQIWRFATYMFLHAGIWHILFNMLFLWMFGSDVERYLGRRAFLTAYFICGIAGAGIFTLANFRNIIYPDFPHLVGASGGISGILVMFAMLFPERVITLLVFLIFPVSIRAKYIVLGAFIIEIIQELSRTSEDRVAHIAHLAGMVFGYFYMKFGYGLSLPFAFTRKMGQSIKLFLHRLRYGRRIRPRYEPVDHDAFISSEIDPILEKISKKGIESLTWRERRILRKARSKMG